jgi:GntR family transcriptional regulator / MocR family aminotransferase
LKRRLLQLPVIDRISRRPLHTQLADAIREAIRSGSLAPGSLLPSTRDLAREAGVSRNTSLAAYAELARQSLLAGRIGSGTRVGGRLSVVHTSDACWRRAIQESRYPQRVATFGDQDGNILYVCSR